MLSNCNRTYTIGKLMFFLMNRNVCLLVLALPRICLDEVRKLTLNIQWLSYYKAWNVNFYQLDIKRGSTKMILCTDFFLTFPFPREFSYDCSSTISRELLHMYICTYIYINDIFNLKSVLTYTFNINM